MTTKKRDPIRDPMAVVIDEEQRRPRAYVEVRPWFFAVLILLAAWGGCHFIDSVIFPAEAQPNTAAETRELRLDAIWFQLGQAEYQRELEEIAAFATGPGSDNPEVRTILDQRVMRLASRAAGLIGGTQAALINNAGAEIPVVGIALQTPRASLELFLPKLRDAYRLLDRLREIEKPDLVLVGSIADLEGP